MSARPFHLRRRGVLFGFGGAIVVAGGLALGIGLQHGGPSPKGPSGPSGSTPVEVTATPLTVSAITPVTGDKSVPYGASITITFSSPINPGQADPTISPAITGTWQTGGDADELTFTPSAPMIPSSSETVTVPAGYAAKDGGVLAESYSSSFTVQAGSTLRLQQLLAELDYLPVGFAPSGTGPALARADSALDGEPTESSAVSLEPEAGSFVWRFAHIPSQLAATWQPGVWNVATEGAVMGFESEHGLDVDGSAGPKVWTALLNAVANHSPTSRPYDYLIATETVPETLYVWSDGKVIYQTPTNSGVTGAETEQGTWPVYLRYLVTTMSGTNPDGTHYSDPGIPWVSYFNGSDAVHGFVRSEYGFPQSDGCLEVPIANAKVIYPLDPYGTLVTVTSGVLTSELGGTTPEIIGSPPPVATTPTTTTTTPAPTTTVVKKRPASTSTTSTTTVPTTTVPPTTVATGTSTG